MTDIENINLDESKHIVTIKDVAKVKPKKISGTQFGVVLGVNTFSSPFQAWCDIMRVYKKPFFETTEILAGKQIEPLQAKYVKERFNLNGMKSPSDMYGENYFKRTRGDFFPMDDYFQGMWDYINTDPQTGATTAVIEMKTTKAEKRKYWEEQIPPYYVLQNGLYAYLLKVNKMPIVASFLAPGDYERPNTFVPDESNTIIKAFTLEKDLPNFEEFYIKPALEWREEHVLTGISPKYDEFNPEDVAIIKDLKAQLKAQEEKKAVHSFTIEDVLKEESQFF